MSDSNVLQSHQGGIVVLMILLALISLVVYWDFLTFTDLFLYKDIGSDTLNTFYPEYVHLADYIRTEGWPGWSFSQGMGQNIFPHGIGDPFDLLIVLMGPEHLAYGIGYIQVLKVMLAGLAFYLYLRVFNLLPMVAVTGAIFYAFSGFMVLGGTWYIFSTDAVYFAFLLYAFERYLKDGVWGFFTVAIALVVSGVSFNLYLYALFFLLYGLFRYYLEYGWRKDLMGFFLRLSGAAVLGMGIGAIFLFANFHEMVNSPRVLGSASLFDKLTKEPLFGVEGAAHNFTAIMRFFSSDLLGSGSGFRGWYNYLEAPMFYCGLLALLLAPQVFIGLKREHKIAYALFLMTFIIPVVFPFYRHLFWAFSGDYYRLYSIFVSFVVMLFSLFALNNCVKEGRINKWLLLVTLVLLILMLFSPFVPADGGRVMYIDSNIRWAAVVFLLLYFALLVFMAKGGVRIVAQCGLLVIVAVEMTGFSWITVNERQVLSVEEFESRVGYNDYSVDALNRINEVDSGFYRVEKTYSSGPAIHRSMNDAKVQGYFGTKSYHSFNQLNYIRFLDALDVLDAENEAQTRWAKGVANDPLLLSFSSVKYILSRNPDVMRGYAQYGFRGVEKVGDIGILLNTLYLPLGFTYDRYMRESDFLSLPQGVKNVALLKALIVDSPESGIGANLSEFDPATISVNYGIESYAEDIAQRRSNVMELQEFSHNYIKGRVVLESPRMLFFTIPYDEGWSAEVDGSSVDLIRANVGFSSLMLEPGDHVVELKYALPYFRLSVVVTLLSLFLFVFLIWRDRKIARAHG